MRRRHLALLFALSLLAAAAAQASPPPLVIFNPSPSVPEGFYLRAFAPLGRGDFVTIRARDAAPDYAGARGFADESDRFIKRVAGVRGDIVCARGGAVEIGGRRVLRAEHDAAGLPLPRWEGCRTLGDEVFLLGDTSDSFDGRYWGVTPLEAVEAVWRRL